MKSFLILLSFASIIATPMIFADIDTNTNDDEIKDKIPEKPIPNYLAQHYIGDDGESNYSSIGEINPSTIGTNTQDNDPDAKTGGKDPLIFGKWYYDENSDARCETKYKFDYDNDGFLENFCYEIVGSIFVIDFDGNGNIDNGAEMFNFDRTQYDMHTPTAFLREYPDTCDHYNCYLWQDTNPKNWIVDDYELIPFSFDIDWIGNNYDGKKLPDNGRYIYCHGMTTEGHEFYCVQPTYWQKGILPTE